MNTTIYNSAVPDLWVSCMRPNPQSRIRLFCFPYAGAGSSQFNTWFKGILPEVELYLVNLPGRDSRIREEPFRDLKQLIPPLTQGLLPHLNKPFVFFGHSMGSLISFEVARELRRLGAVRPLGLVVSGRRPPHAPDTRPIFHRLPEDEFLKTAQKYYGVLPEIILQDQELVGLFLSIMRADLTMMETYQYEQEAPFDCSITVYGGKQDPTVNEQALAVWKEQTLSDFKLKMFPGEHFFIQTARLSVVQDLNENLRGLTSQRLLG